MLTDLVNSGADIAPIIEQLSTGIFQSIEGNIIPPRYIKGIDCSVVVAQISFENVLFLLLPLILCFFLVEKVD